MLTTRVEPELLAETETNIREVVLDNISAGIDPDQSTYFLQSLVPEISEMQLIFSMLVTVPRLQRVPSLKEVMQNLHIEQPSMGLLAYPVLQAADILCVRAHVRAGGQGPGLAHRADARDRAALQHSLRRHPARARSADRRGADAGGHRRAGQDEQEPRQRHLSLRRREDGRAEGARHVHRPEAHRAPTIPARSRATRSSSITTPSTPTRPRWPISRSATRRGRWATWR